MKARLPNPVGLRCPSCGLELQLDAVVARELPQLSCPRCTSMSALYFWLPGGIRQELSARVRSRIYFEAHRVNTRDSCRGSS